MASLKIIYGIDLGTTNSAITRFENGRAVIKKNVLQMDTTPSCVSYTRNGKVLVGTKARNQLGKDYISAFRRPGYKSSTYVEFKRLMGTDYSYACGNTASQVTPEELSAEVLRELRKNILDDDVKSAVITVPAMFNNAQKDATKRAAAEAGFEHVELIQEPVAASVAYGLDSRLKDAYWVVFDFGGGTFDVALMKIDGGVMQAVDTDGHNKLGGKDIDRAIIDELIMPYLEEHYTLTDTIARNPLQFRNMWKDKAEEAKIQLSFNQSTELETDLGDDYGTDDLGEDLSLSMTVTQEDLERISRPIFQKAIDLTKGLLARNGLSGESLGALILVGGPTHSPILRAMLAEQVTSRVDTSIDPMTCVAEGAAVYGSTLDVPEELADKTRDRSKIQLSVNYQSTSVETEEWVSVSLLKDRCNSFSGDSVTVEFARADGVFTSPAASVDAMGDVVCLPIAAGRTNLFNIRCYDAMGVRLDCEPGQISIIQGIAGLGDAVLPMALGLGTLNDQNVEVFDHITGLEKSRKLPSMGFINGLHTPKDIRPGVTSDEVRMSIYQADGAADGTRVLYCQKIYDVFVNGGDLPSLLPAGSEINLRMHAEKSGTIDRLEVLIPALGMTLDLTGRITAGRTSSPSASFITGELRQAVSRARELGNDTIVNRARDLERRYYGSEGDRDSLDSIMSDLQVLGRDIDSEFKLGVWERAAKKMRGMFDELYADNKKYGTLQTSTMVERLRAEMSQVLLRQDVMMAEDLYDQMLNLDYRIAEADFYISWIRDWHRTFAMKRWTDPARARELINQGMRTISATPTAEALKPIAFAIRDCLPGNQRPDILIH